MHPHSLTHDFQRLPSLGMATPPSRRGHSLWCSRERRVLSRPWAMQHVNTSANGDNILLIPHPLPFPFLCYLAQAVLQLQRQMYITTPDDIGPLYMSQHNRKSSCPTSYTDKMASPACRAAVATPMGRTFSSSTQPFYRPEAPRQTGRPTEMAHTHSCYLFKSSAILS